MNKIDLILKLVRENKITDEEAKVLMTTEKEYVYYPWHTYPDHLTPPYTVSFTNNTSEDATITLAPNSFISLASPN